MISYIARAISLIPTTLQNVILVASFIGEIIIKAVLWLCAVLMNIVDSILYFIHIVYEDNVQIFTEIPNTTKEMANTVYAQVLLVQNVVEIIYMSIYNEIEDIVISSTSLANAIIHIASEVFMLTINTALFIGETTWLIITFIPVQLPQLVRSITKYLLNIIINAIVDMYMRLLTFTNYLTEVPLESFLGIISAIIIVRLGIHFKDTVVIKAVHLYWTLLRNAMYIYHWCYNYMTNPEMQMFTGGDVMIENSQHEDIDDPNNTDVLCVICQERQKCVLTLPCRHICLCAECCRRLYGYQRTCPICRTFIYHSVTVYL